MAKSQLMLIKEYFNEGDGKRPLAEFRREYMALTDADKVELAEGIAAITGDEVMRDAN